MPTPFQPNEARPLGRPSRAMFIRFARPRRRSDRSCSRLQEYVDRHQDRLRAGAIRLRRHAAALRHPRAKYPHVQDDIGFDHLFQCRAERSHHMVGRSEIKPTVSDSIALPPCGSVRHAAWDRRGNSMSAACTSARVSRLNMSTCLRWYNQPATTRYGTRWRPRDAAAGRLHLLEFGFDLRDAFTDHAPVSFDLRFTGPPISRSAAALTLKMGP